VALIIAQTEVKMSAALEFTPAVCFPVPDEVTGGSQLRLVADPAFAPPARPPLDRTPARVGDLSVLHAPRQPERAAPVRLTRRGVIVLSALLASVAGSLVWFAALSAPGAPAAGASAPHGSQVTVHAGDTLWTIASRVAPNSDPRAEIAALQQRNHLSDEKLAPGQVLRVP
jgi:nucleoid-associated protein YgaU